MGRGRSKGVKGGSSTASINQAAPAATPTAPIITPQAGQASSDGTLMAVQPTVIHTYFSRQYASYGDEVTVAKTDGNGNFIGAHYAMIQGPLSFGWGRKSFGFVGLHTFFNPTFNDPNLEVMNIYNTPNFRTIGGFK